MILFCFFLGNPRDFIAINGDFTVVICKNLKLGKISNIGSCHIHSLSRLEITDDVTESTIFSLIFIFTNAFGGAD